MGRRDRVGKGGQDPGTGFDGTPGTLPPEGMAVPDADAAGAAARGADEGAGCAASRRVVPVRTAPLAAVGAPA